MNYIFNNDEIINNNTILNMTNLNKEIINYNTAIRSIKYHFSSENMMKYYGNMRDLNCKQTRDLYKYLLDYYLNLFLNKMKLITKMDVMKIEDENDPYTCFIAECMNIIRASIKKYVRLRTSAYQPFWCKREILEERNRNKYGCAVPMREYDYCPSFQYLKQKGKTCKKIIESSMNTNDIFTLGSKLSIIPKFNNIPINKTRNIVKSSLLNRRKTRKIRHTNRNPQINMSNQNIHAVENPNHQTPKPKQGHPSKTRKIWRLSKRKSNPTVFNSPTGNNSSIKASGMDLLVGP
jgi:hypothetical protein